MMGAPARRGEPATSGRDVAGCVMIASAMRGVAIMSGMCQAATVPSAGVVMAGAFTPENKRSLLSSVCQIATNAIAAMMTR